MEEYSDKVVKDINYFYLEIIKNFRKFNYDISMIEEFLSRYDEGLRNSFYVLAFVSGYKDVADKIKQANENIHIKLIFDFKKSVSNGTYKEFLSSFNITEKCSLENDLRMMAYSVGENKDMYSKIISESIEEDMAAIAKSHGCDTVKQWHERILKVDNIL